MRVKNRLSSYPVLNRYDQGSQDYQPGNTISASISLEQEFENYVCKVSFELSCPYIEALIRDDIAKYCVHVECPSSCFRKEYLSRESSLSFSFPCNVANESIEINTFIVMEKDFENFSSKDFHSDYSGLSFNLKKHQIIAIGDAIKYPCTKKDLDKLSSIIKVRRLDNDANGVMTVDTDDSNDFIYVGLQNETFDAYYEQGKNRYKKTSLGLVLFPALIVILERMHQASGNPDVTSRHWYQVIEKQLERNNLSVSDLEIQSDKLLKICQSILGEPIRASFEELSTISACED